MRNSFWEKRKKRILLEVNFGNISVRERRRRQTANLKATSWKSHMVHRAGYLLAKLKPIEVDPSRRQDTEQSQKYLSRRSRLVDSSTSTLV